MKKILIFALGALLIACTKQDLQYQDVKFGYKLVEEYTITKALDHSVIKETIAGTFPTLIRPAFYLNGDETQGTNVDLGTTVTMKVGDYTVKWKNYPTKIANVMDDNYFSKTPQINIDTEVSIVPGTTEYTLPVVFNSFAIVADITEVSKIQYLAANGDFTDIDFFITVGDHLIIFINGAFSDTGVLRLKLIPANSYNKTTFLCLSNKVETIGTTATTHIEHGKYYVLHPDAVTEVGSLFNLSIQEWECGNEED